MRRKDREITDFEKVVSIIEACDCCRIGLVDGGEAYIVPMNFGFDAADGVLTLYFHCAKEGRKIDLIPSQKSAAFEMDTKHTLVSGEKGCDYTFLYQCVMGKGKIEILESRDEKIYGLGKIMRHYSGRDDWEYDGKYLEQMVILKLTAEEWSCKEH